MRHRSVPRLLAIFLVAAAMVPGRVPPAGAAGPNTTVTVFDPHTAAAALGGAPTPAPAAAEIVEATLAHDVDAVTLSVRFKGASDPLTDPDVDPSKSFLTWYFDTGDDCIAIKSGRDFDGRRIGVPSENIVIENNRIQAVRNEGFLLPTRARNTIAAIRLATMSALSSSVIRRADRAAISGGIPLGSKTGSSAGTK
jgi:hypothetical protein